MKNLAKATLVATMMVAPLFSNAEEKENKSKGVDVTANFEMILENAREVNLDDVKEFSFFDKMRFGTTVAKQLSVIDDAYFIYPEEDADYYALLRKPSVYFAMKDVKRHYRKELKANPENKEEILAEFSNLLEKVYGISFQNSRNLEARLKASDDVEDVLTLFAKVEVK